MVAELQFEIFCPNLRRSFDDYSQKEIKGRGRSIKSKDECGGTAVVVVVVASATSKTTLAGLAELDLFDGNRRN